jgi:AraC-like DNA-binding protein
MKTEVARVDLSCGSFDALRAVEFTSSFPPHFHDTFAIGVIESGATRLRTPRGEWIGRAGTILAFSPGEIHSAEPVGDAGWTYRMIYPSAEIIAEMGIDVAALSGNEPLFGAPVLEDRGVAAGFLAAHEPLVETSERGPSEDRMIAAMRALAERYAPGTRSPAVRRAYDARVVERARDFIDTSFAQPVRLQTLADHCGLSLFHLIRVFRRDVGVTPYSYLIQRRVLGAQRMLCGGSTVVDAAYNCGFADQSHLTRAFRKVVGVPPGQYRRSVVQSGGVKSARKSARPRSEVNAASVSKSRGRNCDGIDLSQPTAAS